MANLSRTMNPNLGDTGSGTRDVTEETETGETTDTSTTNDEQEKKLTDLQKWGIIIGGTLLAYYILHKVGALK